MSWIKYQNGNYSVSIDTTNGTKIRETEEDEFKAEFPESIDMKITNRCDMNCTYCHENSTSNGAFGDLLNNTEFLDSLRPYTEVALGGGDPFTHPDLETLLNRLKDRNIISNITVHYCQFLENLSLIERFIEDKLIYGLGVSLSMYLREPLDKIIKFPNAVVHVVAGVMHPKDLEMMKSEYGKDLKILILGYKHFGRGKEYYSQEIENNIQELKRNLPEILKGFKMVSFDNLALEQLDVKSCVSKEVWESCFQGDDGTHSMYIDLVTKKFALNSRSDQRFDLLPTIDEMFKTIKR